MVYFARSIDADLAAWTREPGRKPLILRGARQTGKTASVRQLGRAFELFVELNLERLEDRQLVGACRSAEELLTALRVRHNVVRFPERTLLFFDEVQESAELIAWLRFLFEDHPELFVVAAGSLMEVRLRDRGFAFPVGRVTFRYLHPFSFAEFLGATGRDVLGRHVADAVAAAAGAPGGGLLPPAIHGEATRAFRDYLLVGGMPEAVSRWVAESSPVSVRQVHHDLVQSFAEDLHKYAGVRETAHLEAAFGALPSHYGRRFKYEQFAVGYPSHRMKAALDLLEGALVCGRALPTASVQAPVSPKPRAAAKLLPLDVGIALTTMGVPWTDVRTRPLDGLLDGRVAELAAGVLLGSADRRTGAPLHFWVRESPKANAEVDYLLLTPAGVLPVEVKAGPGGSLKSLHQFLWRAGGRLGLRLHGGPGGAEPLEVRVDGETLRWRLLSLPLYAAEHIPALPIAGPAASSP